MVTRLSSHARAQSHGPKPTQGRLKMCLILHEEETEMAFGEFYSVVSATPDFTLILSWKSHHSSTRQVLLLSPSYSKGH